MTATTNLTTAELLRVTTPNGIDYAYRRFGNTTAGTPVVFLQHFRGNIDNWDPALIDAIAADREVILFDNVGVGATSGTTPSSVANMAHDAVEFIEHLELTPKRSPSRTRPSSVASYSPAPARRAHRVWSSGHQTSSTPW